MNGSAPTRAVVFDLDGTLVDSMPLVLRAFAHALKPMHGDLAPERILEYLGGPPERTFQAMLRTATEVNDAMRRLRDYSLENWRLIRPFGGMHRLLDNLRGAGRAVAVWTGRERESAEWILAEHNIAMKLAACVCGDDLPTHKPHPGGLEETLRKLAVKPDEAIFVGDADVDVLAGAAGGVRTILITHDRTVSADVRGKAWRVTATPAEAYAIVQAEIATPAG